MCAKRTGFEFALEIARVVHSREVLKLDLNLAPTHQWDLVFRDRWLTVS